MNPVFPQTGGDRKQASDATDLRFRVSIQDANVRVSALPYRKASVFKFPKLSVVVRYLEYRRGKYRYFTLFYQGRRETRSTYEAAKKRAHEIATRIQNGETDMLGLRHAEKARYLAALEILAPTKTAIELACSDYAECFQIVGGRCSPAEACREWLERNPIGSVTLNTPKIVEQFLIERDIGSKWRRILKKMLERFSSKFGGPLTSITGATVDSFLDGLKAGPRTRANYLNAIQSLLTFAQDKKYVSRDINLLSGVRKFKVPAVKVNIYSPDELLQLLNKAESSEAGRKLVPLIAITAFTGIRHGEMNEEKEGHLDWSNIDWSRKKIYVPTDVAKTGNDRVVEMPDNLIAWLAPYRRPRGKICILKNTSNAFCRLRTKAGIRGKKKNALRKSFISYKKALTLDVAAVADQAGNSPAMIRKNYLYSDTAMEEAAKRWFALMPTRADVLPLFAWAKGPAKGSA